MLETSQRDGPRDSLRKIIERGLRKPTCGETNRSNLDYEVTRIFLAWLRNAAAYMRYPDDMRWLYRSPLNDCHTSRCHYSYHGSPGPANGLWIISAYPAAGLIRCQHSHVTPGMAGTIPEAFGSVSNLMLIVWRAVNEKKHASLADSVQGYSTTVLHCSHNYTGSLCAALLDALCIRSAQPFLAELTVVISRRMKLRLHFQLQMDFI